MLSIGVQEFLQLGKHHAIYDVRTPTEYAHAHIPGAYNLPIFSDTERAEIGTLYKKYSREKAIRQGFDIFGPKMTSFWIIYCYMVILLGILYYSIVGAEV